MQIDLEDTFYELALDQDQPTVILCEGGVMDFKAYIDSNKSWCAILAEMGLSPMCLRDKRYEAVVHLVTAADGALEFFSHVPSYQNIYKIDTSK